MPAESRHSKLLEYWREDRRRDKHGTNLSNNDPLKTKESIKEFLEDPLKWVAEELLKVKVNEDDSEALRTLVDIIKFINDHRNLVTIPHAKC